VAIPETTRKLGQIVVDFANAQTSDEACLKHFENMRQFMSFHSDFTDKVKEQFPTLSSVSTPRSEAERFKELISKEQEAIDSINAKLGWEYDVDIEDRYEQKLRVRQIEILGGGDYCDANVVAENVSNIREFKHEFGAELEEEVLALQKVWRTSGSNFLHEGILNLQKDLREAIDSIAQGKHLDEIPTFLDFLVRYNGVQKSNVLLADADLLIEVPPINEWDYIGITAPKEWVTRLQDDLAYCLIEFLIVDDSRKHLHKCLECTEFYVSKTVGDSKFCSGKCRSKHHHSKPEYKEKKAKERREMFGWKKSERKK
jgi:hypothetical protein